MNTILKTFIFFVICLHAISIAQAAGAHPELSDTEAKMARKIQELQSEEEKISEMEKFCSTQEAKAGSHYNLGCLYAQAGKYREAAKSFNTALEKFPEFTSAAKNLVLSLDACNSPHDELMPQLEKAMELCGLQDKDLLLIAARTHFKRGDYRAALDACRIGLICSYGTKSRQFGNLSAEISIANGDYKYAADELKFLLSQDPKDSRSWELLFAALTRAEEFKEAAAVWEASGNFGCRPDSRAEEAAMVYYNLGLYRDCADIYINLISSNKPGNPKNLARAARALLASGEYELSEKLCDKLSSAKNIPDDVKISAMECKLESMTARNAPEDAIKELSKKILSYDEESPAANFAEANFLKSQGKYRSAIIRYEICAKNGRYKRASLLRAAACYISLSERERAIEILERLNGESPSEELRRYIEILKSGK